MTTRHPVRSPLTDLLAVLPDGWQERRAGRVEATRDSPQLFAYLYLRRHLRLVDGRVTFSRVHESWYRAARGWTTGESSRDVYVAPRSLGKSTHFFLLLPMWAAAHGWVRFAAAFSDSALQAEQHLATFKHELDSNDLLRYDYPSLCRPARRPRGQNVSDNRGMVHVASGFVFAARGIDSGNLGMKVEQRRPDLLVLDDIEPGAANYSSYQVSRRLETLTDVILPLNDRARVVVVGTTTMSGSLIHQAVRHAVEPARWITDERFRVHHALPFDERDESIWPERWSTEELRLMRGTRSFAKNFLNQPVPEESEYWTEADFRLVGLADSPESATRRVIAVDPAVTTNRTSDRTGIAVVGYSAARHRCVVDEVTGVREKGEPIRRRVLDLIARYPDVQEIHVERNQGGDTLVDAVYRDMPVPVTTVHNTVKKELRAEELLSYYRRGQVLHARRFPELEQEMLEFPRGLHDDLIDAVGLGVTRSSSVQVARRPRWQVVA